MDSAARPRVAGDKKPGSAGRLARAIGAFFCITLSLRLMNASLFPLFDSVMPLARDLGVATGVATNLTAALMALYRPSLLHERAFAVAAALLCAAATPAALAGVAASSPALLAAGSVARGLGSSWVSLLTLTACSTLGPKKLLVGIPLAAALAQGAGWGFSFAPSAVGLSALALCPLVAVGLAAPISRPVVAAIASAPPLADAAITRPSSFLPLNSKIFVCQLLVTAVCGFSLRFGAQEGDLATAPATLAALLAIAAWNVRGSERRFDEIFDMGVLLAVGAFLVAPLSSYTWATLGLLSMGDACFTVVFTLMFLAVARRNPLQSLTVFGWGNVMASLGSILGANLGAAVGSTGGSDGAFVVSAAVAVAFLGCVLFGLRGFSFSQTIDGIEPVMPLQPANDADPARFGHACGALAREHGLTPREQELLALLARGRNNQFIQDELVLTRNTVKTYIKRIYGKLDVHSQQQLIDLVEKTAPGK